MAATKSSVRHQGTSTADGYDSWRQIAGYFDGDGCLSIRKVATGTPFTVGLTLDFIDQSRKQILMIESFMRRRGVAVGRPSFRGGAWTVSIGAIRAVKSALQRMLPYLCKKSVEARAALDYLEGRISGNEFQLLLLQEVKQGNRERMGRQVDLPWTRPEGLRRAIMFATSFPRKRRVLTRAEEDRIVEQYLQGSIGQRKLAKANGLPHAVVRRVLARRGLAATPK